VQETLTGICWALGGDCRKVVSEARKAGIDCILDYGEVVLRGGFRLVGKGWAGFVVAARHRGRVVALKALKPTGRRASLLGEGIAAYAAGLLGVMKQVLYIGEAILVYEYISGPPLAAYIPTTSIDAIRVARTLLRKAYLLDTAGLRHNELSRPGRQVIVEVAKGAPQPYIIDYESATWHRSPASNLTQLIGGLTRTPLGRVCGIDKLLAEGRLVEFLRRYRATKSLKEKKLLHNTITEMMVNKCVEG